MLFIYSFMSFLDVTKKIDILSASNMFAQFVFSLLNLRLSASVWKHWDGEFSIDKNIHDSDKTTYYNSTDPQLNFNTFHLGSIKLFHMDKID